MSDKEIAMNLTLQVLAKHDFILTKPCKDDSERLENVSMQLSKVFNAIYKNLQELK